MGCSDGEGLSQLYLELVDAYEKRFIPQNGQVTVLKCSAIWKRSILNVAVVLDPPLKF